MMQKSARMLGIERRNFWATLRWSAALALLLVPLLAMRFSGEVAWSTGDFLFAALVIGGAGLAYELAVRTVAGGAYRAAVAAAVTGAVLVLWVNGAVGFVGDEGDRANLVFYAVIGLGSVGAIATLARPAPMAWVMSTMSVLQVAVGISTVGMDPVVIPATIFFTGLWILSAHLFHRAARRADEEAIGS